MESTPQGNTIRDSDPVVADQADGTGPGGPINASVANRINFVQLNCHKSCLAHSNISNIFNTLGIGTSNILKNHVALLQEPFCKSGKCPEIVNMKLFRGVADGRVRACIYVSNHLKAFTLNQFSDSDMVTISIDFGTERLLVTSLYMPFDRHEGPITPKLINLVKYANDGNLPLIVGTDANSHHRLWGSSDDNHRGELLFDFIMEENLDVLNIGTKPTFSAGGRNEVLDVTIVNESAKNRTNGWAVLDIESFSDHMPIKFELILNREPLIEKFFNVRKTQWDEFTQFLEENFDPAGIEDIDEKAEYLTNLIMEGFYNATPESRRNKHAKDKIWWSSDLKKQRKKTERLRRKMKRNRTEERVRDYQEAKREFGAMLRKRKNEKWHDFCRDMRSVEHTSKAMKFLKNSNIVNHCTLMDDKGNYAKDAQESLDILFNAHFEDSGNRSDEPSHQWSGGGFGDDAAEVSQEIFSLKRITSCFDSFKNFKSPGKDGIYPILIKKALPVLGDFVKSLYSECFEKSYVPVIWQVTKVVFIPKPGKPQYNSPKSFRPISLLSFLLKGFERLILWHLEEKYLNDDNLHRNLFAYRKGMSTETALHAVCHGLEKAKVDKDYAIAVFLDIDSAFSKATVGSMLAAAKDVIPDANVLNWLHYFLTNRNVELEWGGATKTADVARGCAQGGIISPLLWNLVMNKLLKDFHGRSPSMLFCYADDLALISKGKDLSTVKQSIQNDLLNLEQWARLNNLSFSASKTKSLMVTSKRDKNFEPLILNNEPIEWVESFKYLGVTIDKNLTFGEHLESVTKKAMYTLFHIKKLVGKDWGASPKVLKWTYEAMVVPVVTYGCLVWIKNISKVTYLKKLRRVQGLALRTILGAQRSTPLAAMEVVTNTLPLDLVLEEKAILSCNRLIKAGHWRRRAGELGLTNTAWLEGKVTNYHPHLGMCWDRGKHRIIEPMYGTLIQDRQDESHRVVTNENATVINCFTDGSKDEFGRTGASSFITCKTFRHYDRKFLGKSATVFQAELIGIKMAAEYLSERKVEGKTVLFNVDNQAAIKSLGNLANGNVLINEIKVLLNCLSRDNLVTVKWLPGHMGYMGNEVADRLAKLGTKTETLGCEPFVKVSVSQLETMTRNLIISKHSTRWKNLDSCKHTKRVFHELRPRESRWIMNQSRCKLNRIIGFVTGHGRLNYHQFRIGNAVTPLCRLCGEEEETGWHIMGECPAIARERFSFLGLCFHEEKVGGLVDFVSLKNLQKFLAWVEVHLETM